MASLNDSGRPPSAGVRVLLCAAVLVTSARPAPARGGVMAIDQGSACVGDCNDTGAVTIDDLLTMVNATLGSATVSECLAGDGDQDGAITVDEILTAVNRALNGCGG